MSTLPIRALQIQFAWPIAGLARVRTVVSAAFDVFAEAQRNASAAQNRYPCAEW